MARRPFWSPKKRAVAVTLREEGYTLQEVANRIGGNATASGVRKVCLKFKQTGKVADRARIGRPRISTQRDDRKLVRLTQANRRKSSTQLMVEWGVNASRYTIRRRLNAAGLKVRIPRKRPYLNLIQRQRRIQWAKDHLDWNNEQWKHVLWSDETKISVFQSDRPQHVWRRVGEADLPECTVPTMKYPLSVMIWGCMAASGVGRIFVVEKTVNADVYIRKILEGRMLPSAHDLFPSQAGQANNSPVFVYQQDNAPCHTARVCKEWFKRNKIDVLDWPGNSPDLNPIENLWATLKRLVAKERPSSKTTLIEAILKSWNHVIDNKSLQNLVASMPRRCAAVIKAKGYATKY